MAILKQRCNNLIISPIYQSPALGFDGDAFLNLVVKFNYNDSLDSLRKWLYQMENQHDGNVDGPRYQPRTLDLDLLLFGDLIEINSEYEIPRSDITKFAFVLKPLVDIAPDLVHPQLQLSMSQLWAQSKLQAFPLHKISLATSAID